MRKTGVLAVLLLMAVFMMWGSRLYGAASGDAFRAQRLMQCIQGTLPCNAKPGLGAAATGERFIEVKSPLHTFRVWFAPKGQHGKPALQMDVWNREKSKLIEGLVDDGPDGNLDDGFSNQKGLLFKRRGGPLPRHYQARLKELDATLFPFQSAAVSSRSGLKLNRPR
jgi:hypothetical protein